MATWTAVANSRAQRAPLSKLGTAIVGGSGEYPVRDPDPAIYANQSDLYRRLSWVYGAVSRVSESIASLANLGVYTLGGEKKTASVNHPFERLLRKPNPYQFDSRFEFYEAITGYLKLNGNCYIWLNSITLKSAPNELWLLRPDRVTIVPDREKFIKGYVYEIENSKIVFDADEVVHLKLFNPLNDWYGLSAIEALAIAAETDLSEAAWNKNFFGKDNAKPQGALAYAEHFDDDSWTKMKQDVATEHGGTKRRLMMIRGAGAGGVQWLNMAITQKDMEFFMGRQFNKEEIYAILAPGLVQAIDKNTTEANSIAGEKTYREYALYPILQRIAEKFTSRIMPRYGAGLVCEFEEIRIRDRNMVLSEIQAYERTHTIAEVRAKHFDDAPLGDERDNLFVTQVTTGQPTAPDGTPLPPNSPWAALLQPFQGGQAATPGVNPFTAPTQQTEPTDATAATVQSQQAAEQKALTEQRLLSDKSLERKRFKSVVRKDPARSMEFKFQFLTEAEQAELRELVITTASVIQQRTQRVESKSPDVHNGIMIALAVPESVGKQLLDAVRPMLPAGAETLSLDELHVTLAYMGDADTYEHSREDVARVVEAFAKNQATLRGRINGIGRFNPGEDGQVPLYANFDCQVLPGFHLGLVQTLQYEHIPFKQEHGFTAHITLAYVPVSDLADTPALSVPTDDMECEFDGVTLAWAGEWQTFPLREYVNPLPPTAGEDFAKALEAFTRAIEGSNPIEKP